jgi:nucleoside-diphosphate-sugar epimerase
MGHYLITGGAGFIGSNLVEELLKQGEKVRVLDNFSTGRRDNLKPFINDIELVEGDIRSLSTVYRAVDGVDYVLHQAALPSVQRSVEDPITTNEVNITGTLNVLIASRDRNVKRVVFASSSSIYGDNDSLPKREDMKPDPLSPYAAAKLTGEKYCKIFTEVYGLSTIVLRYFNVFGSRQDPTSQYSAVIPKFIYLMKNKNVPTIYGDGEQSRDFTYIKNVVNANLLACKNSDLKHEIFNCAGQEQTSINQLVKNLNEILKTDVQADYDKPRSGEVKHSLADISKAKSLLNYNLEVNFKDGLKKTVEWFLSLSG